MLSYIQHSKTVVIVLHEIYGINNHIINVSKKISKYGIDSIVPNLLQGREEFTYDQEAIAYHYFRGQVGFTSALKQVKEVIYKARANYQKVYVLGYSMGATLAWLCSETGLCDLTIGFYGSRIRDYLMIKPKCPVLLFFPAAEKSFAVDDLILRLSDISNIQIKKLAGQHGFANPFSQNYNKKSATKACLEIISFVKSIKCDT